MNKNKEEFGLILISKIYQESYNQFIGDMENWYISCLDRRDH